MNIAEQTHVEVYNHLQKEYEENPEFREELEKLFLFYGRKLINFVKKDEQREYIENEFGDVVKSLYFQGYYTMNIILSDEETSIPEEVWTLPSGVLRNELPTFLSKLLQDEKLDWKTEISHQFSMDILTYLEEAYETTKEITKEISEFGAFKALQSDSRYKGQPEQEDTGTMLLGTPYDLDFVSPQVYAKPQIFTDEHEIWDMFFWSSIQKDDWVGTMHLSKVLVEEERFYILEFSLSDLITSDEKLEIIDVVTKRIASDIRSTLQIRLYNVSELSILQINNETKE